jgi:cell wall-associated NlpC family hydrolase
MRTSNRSNIAAACLFAAAVLVSCATLEPKKESPAPHEASTVQAQAEAKPAAAIKPSIAENTVPEKAASIAQAQTQTAGRPPELDHAKEREKVVQAAKSLLGQKPDAKVTVAGRNFTLDCIGTVSAAWWGAGYDIQRDFPKHEGNGVNRLYFSMKDWGALHELREPKPGDVIFWSNTYDRNENGKLDDDGLTHAGIVIEVEDDGTVHYLHESYSRGVVIAFFNLRYPNTPLSPAGKVWNSPMYLGSNYDKKNNPPHWLSGDLWSAFGDAGKTAATLR